MRFSVLCFSVNSPAPPYTLNNLMIRRAHILLFLIPFILGGCIEDIVRSLIPISPRDGEVWVPDGLIVDGDIQVGAGLSVTGLKPPHGPFVGGTEVYVSGSGFDKSASVKIGGVSVSSTKITLVSPQALKITTPAGKVGAADVEVSLSKGANKATLSGGFTFDPVYLDPDSGPVAGGTLVTVSTSGVALTASTTMTLGGVAMTGLTLVSASTMRALTPKTDRTGPAPW